VKIATWNINSIKSRVQHVINWSEVNQPDVLCLQETKCPDDKFPIQKLRAVGYEHAALFGERTYNGVAILSVFPIEKIQRNLPDDPANAQKRLLAGTINGIRIVNVYAPHGTRLGSEKYTYKLNWIKRLRNYFDTQFKRKENVLLCGDLNVAPHELDVWKISVWRNKLHFTKAERDAIQELKKWGFVDLFRQINDDAKEFTWWDHFLHSVEMDKGLRLDHLWASPPLAELCTDCWIDKKPRTLEHPSDHAPVVAEFRDLNPFALEIERWYKYRARLTNILN
jgi:exodeoxyribonuclease-3